MISGKSCLCFKFDAVVHDAANVLNDMDVEGDGVLTLYQQFGLDVEGEEAWLTALLGTAI